MDSWNVNMLETDSMQYVSWPCINSKVKHQCPVSESIWRLDKQHTGIYCLCTFNSFFRE